VLHEDAGRSHARRGTTPLAPPAAGAGRSLSFFGCDGPDPFGSSERRLRDGRSSEDSPVMAGSVSVRPSYRVRGSPVPLAGECGGSSRLRVLATPQS